LSHQAAVSELPSARGARTSGVPTLIRIYAYSLSLSQVMPRIAGHPSREDDQQLFIGAVPVAIVEPMVLASRRNSSTLGTHSPGGF
jgi:hypothetical protein